MSSFPTPPSHSDDPSLVARQSQQMQRNERYMTLTALMLVHLFLGWVSACFSADRPAISSCIFLAIIFCQVGLVGMWCGLGRVHVLIRWPVGIIAGLYLAALLGVGIGEFSTEVFFVVLFAALLVGAAMQVVRLLWAELRAAELHAQPSREGLQFGIRHLLVLTFSVACLTSLGKFLAPYVQGINQMMTLVTIGICVVAVALAQIWAMLGSGHVALRLVVAFALAGGAGWLVVFFHREDGFWIGMSLLQAALTAATLGVLRRLGYRFVSRR